MSEQSKDNPVSQNGMNTIPASAITVGVRFSDNVYFDDGEHMFLSAGNEAKLYHEEAVARWKVSVLFSKGHVISPDEH